MPEARRRLAPLAFDPHGGGLSERTRKVIDLIDTGKSRHALSELQSGAQGGDDEKKGG